MVPPETPDAGTLYLCSPAEEAASIIQNYLSEKGFGLTELRPGVVAVPFDRGGLTTIADDLLHILTDTQLSATRSLVVPQDVIPSLADLMSTRSLATLFAGLRHRWLPEVIRHGRLVTHFQPIVPASDPGTVYGYECLTRGLTPDGKIIPPNELFAAARTTDLMFALDRSARLTAIREAVEHGATAARLFVNFNPTAIYTPSFCLRTTFRAIEQAGISPDRVVFEVVESDQVPDSRHLLGILEAYRSSGFRVALDDVGAGYSSLTLLTKLRPDFVKLDMGLTRDVDRDPYKASVVRKLLEMAHEVGAKTVVEGVETTGEWEWAKAHGADYIQGYLFARPACPPPAPRVPAAA